MSSLLVVAATAAALLLLTAPRAPVAPGLDAGGRRGRALRAGVRTRGGAEAPPTGEVAPRLVLVAQISVGVTAWLVLGGTVGALVGLIAGAALRWWLRRQEPRHVVAHRERLAAELPHVVDLLAALLRAGHAPASAAAVVGATVEGPAGEVLRAVARRERAGLDAYAVWRPVAEEQGTALLGAAMLRSLDSGARVVDVVDRVAEELRRDARAAAAAQARTVGVRATAPLAACFLPALICIGVVPFVASLVTPLLGRLGGM